MLFLKIWNLPTGFNLKWLAHFFSLPKFPYQTCVCFQVLWSKGNLDSYRKSKMHEKMFSYSSISFTLPPAQKRPTRQVQTSCICPFFSAQKALWGWWYKMVACPRVQRKLVLVLPFGRQLYLACISPKVIPTSLKKFDEQDWLQFLICNLNSPKKLTCRLWAS